MESIFKSFIFIMITALATPAVGAGKPVKSQTKENEKKSKFRDENFVDRPGHGGQLTPLLYEIPRAKRAKGKIDLDFVITSRLENYAYDISLNVATANADGHVTFNKVEESDPVNTFIMINEKPIKEFVINNPTPGPNKITVTYYFNSNEAKNTRLFALGFSGHPMEAEKPKGSAFKIGMQTIIRPSIFAKIFVQRADQLAKSDVKFGTPYIKTEAKNTYLVLPVENRSKHVLRLKGSYKSQPEVWNAVGGEAVVSLPGITKTTLKWPVNKFNLSKTDARVYFEIFEKNEGLTFKKSAAISTKNAIMEATLPSINLTSETQSLNNLDRTGKYLAWAFTLKNPTDKELHVELTQTGTPLPDGDGGYLCKAEVIKANDVIECAVFLKKNTVGKVTGLPFLIRIKENGNSKAMVELPITTLNVVYRK